MATTRPPLIVRFERTIAPALASAAASAPSIVGVALAVTAFAFDDVVWAAAAGFAAAALLRQTNRALMAVVMVLAALRVVDVGIALAEDATSWTAQWRVLVAGSALLGLTMGPFGSVLIDGLLGGAFLCVAAQIDLAPIESIRGIENLVHVAVVLGALIAARLASRRLDGAAFVALVVTGAQLWYGRHVVTHHRDLTETVATTVLLDAAIIAGAFAADLREGARPDAGTGLVVLVQRRPWIAATAIAFVAVGLSGPWAWSWYPVENIFDGQTLAPLVPAAFAMLAHVGRGGRSDTGRLASWFAASAASAALAWGLTLSSRVPISLPFSHALGLTALFTLWPLVAEALIPGRPPGDAAPFAALAFPTTIVLLPPLAAWIFPSDENEAWSITAALCLLLLPVAFHAVVRVRQPTGWILMYAALFGAAWQMLRPAAPPRSQFVARYVDAHPSSASLVLGPAAWLLAGVLVVAARRCRSVTAVPLDHPVVSDFGGR